MRLGICCAALLLSGCNTAKRAALKAEAESLKACQEMASDGFRAIAKSRDQRFLGKVQEVTALCRGGPRAVEFRVTPWVDWSNYFGTGDGQSRGNQFVAAAQHLGP